MMSIALIGSMAATIAAFSKNRNLVGWALAGFLFPVLGALAICALPEEPVGKEAL